MNTLWLRMWKPILLVSLGLVWVSDMRIPSSGGCPAGTCPYRCPGAKQYGCATPNSVVSCPDGTQIVMPSNCCSQQITNAARTNKAVSTLSAEAMNVLKDLQATYQKVMALKVFETVQGTYQEVFATSKIELLYRTPVYFVIKQEVTSAGLSELPYPKRLLRVCDGTSLYATRSDYPKVYLEKPLSKDEKTRFALTDIMDSEDLLVELLAGKLTSEQNIQKVLVAMGEWEQGAAPNPSAWRVSSLQVKPQSNTHLLTIEAQISGSPSYGTSTLSIWVKQLGQGLYQLMGYRVRVWNGSLVRTVNYESTLYWQASSLPLSLFHYAIPQGAIRKVLPAEASGGDVSTVIVDTLPQLMLLHVGQRPLPLAASQYPSGTALSWEKFKGKVVLLDFWAPWCAPCVAELPHLRALYTKYRRQGFVIIGDCLLGGVTETELKSFLQKYGVSWPISLDKGTAGGLAARFHVEAIPSNVLVGRDGRVLAVNVHGTALDKALSSALSDGRG
ncbi:thiol-disulfide isomerase-like thioredoxin [Chthonomonas calidirosea]|nr:thiol-disulfide isomerase-like thioredoxin [Chthonomonas calidirosea]